MARPSRLTPEVQQAIVVAIASGNTRRTAAAYAGVEERTLYRWLAGDSPAQRQLSQAVQKAEADAVVASVALIRQAARESWQAAAWWLERRYPDEWGRKDRVAIEHVLKTEADKIAEELGLDAAEVLANAELILSRGG